MTNRAILIKLLSSFVFCSVRSTNLLLLGDSLDRHATCDWCESNQNQGLEANLTEWGPKSLISSQHLKAKKNIFICKTRFDTIASVQFFGSNATGPYRGHLIKYPNEVFDHTKARIELSISSYQSLFGNPDRIIFQTVAWDVANVKFKNPKYDRSDAVKWFKKNIRTRIYEIRHLVAASVDVGVRTTPRCYYSRDLTDRFNGAIRQVAREDNLTLYDYDHDIWSSVKYDITMEPYLFRDWIHPKKPYSNRAADKMLGRQYSRFMNFKPGTKSSEYYNINSQAPFSNLTKKYLWYDMAANVLYFHNQANGSRHLNPNVTSLRALRLNLGDVYQFRGSQSNIFYENTHLGAPFSTMLSDATIYNVSLDKKDRKLYYLRSQQLRPLRDEQLIFGLGKQLKDVVQLDHKETFLLSMFPVGKDVLLIYKRTLDWVVKKESGVDFFLIRGGLRFEISGAESISDLVECPHLKFVNITHSDDIDFLPLSTKVVRREELHGQTYLPRGS